jgi:hypothetical protein
MGSSVLRLQIELVHGSVKLDSAHLILTSTRDYVSEDQSLQQARKHRGVTNFPTLLTLFAVYNLLHDSDWFLF